HRRAHPSAARWAARLFELSVRRAGWADGVCRGAGGGRGIRGERGERTGGDRGQARPCVDARTGRCFPLAPTTPERRGDAAIGGGTASTVAAAVVRGRLRVAGAR